MKGKVKKPRNYHALNAIQRSAAGPMKDKIDEQRQRDMEALDEAHEAIERSRELRKTLRKKYGI
jgi:hypothetical protein